MAYGTINADLMTTSDGVSSSGLYGFKNRIINGAMVIDQRNAGASITPTGDAYTVDRWRFQTSQSSKLSFQQNAGSVTPPTGYTNYLGCTSLSAYSITSSDIFIIGQSIEGFNVADLGWGTASAQTVTISFWVRSSLTGTFGGSIFNGAGNRSYPFTYTISSANTWEQKSITVAGDTSGTWLTTNGKGMQINWGLGNGSTVSGTAGSWSGNTYWSATGATSVVGTNGATFYITGVQLEKGSTATSFDYRPYGTELQLCQRYYQQFAALGNVANLSFVAIGNVQAGGTSAFCMGKLNQTMRSAPSFSYSGTLGTDIKYNITGDATPSSISSDQMNPDNFSLSVGVSGNAGYCCRLISFTNSGQFKFSSEL